jgi:hypothetical protein
MHSPKQFIVVNTQVSKLLVEPWLKEVSTGEGKL